jgi:hypothetical protein
MDDDLGVIVAVGDRSTCGPARGQVFSGSEGYLNQPTFEPLDTTADARDVQREAYRRLGGVGRMAILFRLTALVRETALAGIRSRHPEYDDAQVQMAWRRLALGDDLARKAWPDRELVDP